MADYTHQPDRHHHQSPDIEISGHEPSPGNGASFPEKTSHLLIPEAVFYVGDTLKRIVTPRQYERLKEKPKDIACAECGTPIYFVEHHVKKGHINIADQFRTKANHTHGDQCNYHDRKAMANIEEHAEYDETQPYRIHLNIQDREIRNNHLRSEMGGRFYKRANGGKYINKLYETWQPISIKSMNDLLHFIEIADAKRLRKSIVILNNRDITWNEFCLTPRKGQWDKFFDDLRQCQKHLRLFFVQRAHKDGKHMAPLPSDIVRCDQINPRLVSGDGQIILNPRIKVSGETIPIVRENLNQGLAILTTASGFRFIGNAQGRARIYECVVDAQIPDFVRSVDYKKLVEDARLRLEQQNQGAKSRFSNGFDGLTP